MQNKGITYINTDTYIYVFIIILLCCSIKRYKGTGRCFLFLGCAPNKTTRKVSCCPDCNSKARKWLQIIFGLRPSQKERWPTFTKLRICSEALEEMGLRTSPRRLQSRRRAARCARAGGGVRGARRPGLPSPWNRADRFPLPPRLRCSPGPQLRALALGPARHLSTGGRGGGRSPARGRPRWLWFPGEGHENKPRGSAGLGGAGRAGGARAEGTLLHPVHFTGNRSHPGEGPGGARAPPMARRARGRPARRRPLPPAAARRPVK